MQRPPAEIGMPLAAVDTPALLVDMDAFERNLDRMARAAAQASIRLRPHAKSHKCPAIALQQIARGAVGVCCQKVAEAEVMVYGGVPDVLVTNEIVGPTKIARLVALARQARIAVCADDAGNVATLSAAAQAFNVRLSVLVEVNVGADRCGVEPGEPTLALARQIAAAPGLTFAGLQAYQGAAQHLRPHADRQAAIAKAVDKVRATRDLLGRHGLACPHITGAGTGSFHFETVSGLYTELQAGSYIFMDVDYGKNLAADGTPDREFAHSLFVYATVMSRPTAERAVVDAGLKAMSVDAGLPVPADLPDVEYIRAAE